MTKRKKADENGLEMGILPTLTGYQLRLTQIAIFRDFSETLGEFDVTPGLFGVLVVIEANPGLKQTELARASHLDRSTVVSVIDNLERRGLVERRQAENDRRSNAIVITCEGAALLKKLKRRVADHEKRLVEHLSEDEQATLVSLMKRIFPEHR
jgi:DNA-binding MarR family transcriptional regulator